MSLSTSCSVRSNVVHRVLFRISKFTVTQVAANLFFSHLFINFFRGLSFLFSVFQNLCLLLPSLWLGLILNFRTSFGRYFGVCNFSLGWLSYFLVRKCFPFTWPRVQSMRIQFSSRGRYSSSRCRIFKGL